MTQLFHKLLEYAYYDSSGDVLTPLIQSLNALEELVMSTQMYSHNVHGCQRQKCVRNAAQQIREGYEWCRVLIRVWLVYGHLYPQDKPLRRCELERHFNSEDGSENYSENRSEIPIILSRISNSFGYSLAS